MSILSDIAGKIKERVDAETAARGVAFAGLQTAHDSSMVTFKSEHDASVDDNIAQISDNVDLISATAEEYTAELQAAADAVRSNVAAGIDSITETVADMNAKGTAIQSSINTNTGLFNDALAAHVAALGDSDDFGAGFEEGSEEAS